MGWKKLGRVFVANEHSQEMIAGARAPVPLWLGSTIYRVFFGAYDACGRGRIFSLVIDLEKPQRVLDLDTRPLVDIGEVGCFDDNGIIPSWALVHEDRIYLYTIGFSIKNKVLFDSAAGVATSRDGGKTFCKVRGPVLDRGVDDPCFATSPCVLREGDRFKMWYVSCVRWSRENDGLRHYYNIRERSSDDPLYWPVRSRESIPFQTSREYAIARPSVLKELSGRYKMWYCFREQAGITTYRIGYAESDDGERWARDDSRCDLDVSLDGWDSEMLCYPNVFDHSGVRFMLYNGNRYGRSGFGLAVLEE